jgi:hypothetical protein|tara:strand:- start:407 stop:994 length:588 start_codon:yes stop_codon:yes gene_type:complete
MTPEELQKLEEEVYALDDKLRTDENFDDYEKSGRYKAPSFDDYLEQEFPEEYRKYKEKKRKLDQAKEEARRRKANEAPIPSDEDAPVGLPEEVGVTTAPAGSQVPSKTKEAKDKRPRQLELDLKRTAQAAKLMEEAAKARRAMKAGKTGMSALRMLGSGVTRGLALPIELLSIISGPTMRAIQEEYENKDKPKGT